MIGYYIDLASIIHLSTFLSILVINTLTWTSSLKVYDVDMNSLIKKALSRPMRRQATKKWTTKKNDVELAVAWAKGEVSLSQVYHAYGIPIGHGSKIYGRLAMALRAHIQNL